MDTYTKIKFGIGAGIIITGYAGMSKPDLSRYATLSYVSVHNNIEEMKKMGLLRERTNMDNPREKLYSIKRE